MSTHSGRRDRPRQQPRSGTRVYRARTFEEVLPKIREDLGPHAVVIGQRETLGGGFAGFFQHPVVEVAVRPEGAGGVDVYDDGGGAPDQPLPREEANGTAFEREQDAVAAAQEGLRSEAIQQLLSQAAPFAEQLSSAADAQARGVNGVNGEAEPVGLPAAVDLDAHAEPVAGAERPAGPRPASVDAIEARLVTSGIPQALAADLVADTVSHTLPFATPRSLKRLVRSALARCIPVQPSFHGRRRTIALVGAGGAGKTLCVARLASAYATGSDLPVCVVTLASDDSAAELAAVLEPRGVRVEPAPDVTEARGRRAAQDDAGLAVIDTPSVSPGDREAVAELGKRLRAMRPDEVHLALPATLSRVAADELLDALEALGVSRLLLTHTDETAHIGPAIGLAVARRLPFSYVSQGTDPFSGMLPADADDLAGRALP